MNYTTLEGDGQGQAQGLPNSLKLTYQDHTVYHEKKMFQICQAFSLISLSPINGFDDREFSLEPDFLMLKIHGGNFLEF